MATDCIAQERATREDLNYGPPSYYAYLAARAAFDVALYGQDGRVISLTDQDLERLSADQENTMHSFLLEPARDLAALSLKLQTCREQEALDNWHKSEEILDALVRDADRLQKLPNPPSAKVA